MDELVDDSYVAALPFPTRKYDMFEAGRVPLCIDGKYLFLVRGTWSGGAKEDLRRCQVGLS
jgi:hypothetical protein